MGIVGLNSSAETVDHVGTIDSCGDEGGNDPASVRHYHEFEKVDNVNAQSFYIGDANDGQSTLSVQRWTHCIPRSTCSSGAYFLVPTTSATSAAQH